MSRSAKPRCGRQPVAVTDRWEALMAAFHEFNVRDRIWQRVMVPPPPAEGEGGLFSQTWFPICLSDELPRGAVMGVDFLGGRVIAFRGTSGRSQVLSAYCVHLGADLSVGDVINDTIQCRFHHWQYGADGVCTATGIGDPVPRQARVFRFPTVEKYGLVWAFNGEEPLFPLPDLSYPEDCLVLRTMVMEQMQPTDPWVVTAQTLDLQHFSLQHEFELLEDPNQSVSTTDHSMGYHLSARMRNGQIYDVRVNIHGTNTFWQAGMLDDRWFFWITALGVPWPGESKPFFVYGTARREGEEETATQAFLDQAYAVMMGMMADDSAVLTTIKYKPGLLTASDNTLSAFMQYLRCHPRAHPSAQFIN
jgi:nitrite reductase/ring-hydroxylating ferredoxin subunit